MIEQIIQEVEAIKEAMIDDIMKIVSIDSLPSKPQEGMPFGEGIATCLEEALAMSEKLGFTTKNIDGYMGYAQYGEGDDYIAAVGHLDVVPVGEGWNTPPFVATRINQRIYGRGILDNKGPIISCLYALYVLKRLNIEVKHPLRVIFGTNEETGMKDVPYYLTKEKAPMMGWTPDCKYPVVYGERGRAKFTIRANITEAKTFCELITTYFLESKPSGDRLEIDFHDDEFGLLEMRGYHLSSHQENLSFTFTISYPASCNIEVIHDKIKSKLSDQMEITMIQHFLPVKFDKTGKLCQTLKQTYELVTGEDGTPVTTTGGTYAKVMPNILPFGPSFPGQKGIGHNPNEWMDVDDLVKNAKIYALSFYELGCK